MGAIPAILSTVGTIISTISSIGQANAQARQDKEQAKAIQFQGNLERFAYGKEAQRVLAQNRNIAAGSGLDPDSGTIQAVNDENAFMWGFNDALQKYRNNVSARQYNLRALNYQQQVPGIALGGALKAAGSLVGTKGSGGLYDWYKDWNAGP